MQRLFEISLTILAAAAGIILAGAEESPLPAITAPLALATLLFVDWGGWVRLPQSGLTLLAGGAFLVAGLEYRWFYQNSAVTAGGHLLVYLMWIFLLQPKDERRYWWILALTLLQVAIASASTFSIWFGLGLAAYSFLAIWTLTIFLLARSDAPASVSSLSRAPAPEPAVAAMGVGAGGPRLSIRFGGVILSATTLSLAISMLFFLLIPRIWTKAQDLEANGMDERLTGFTNEVRLGAIGEILESREQVLTVRAYRAEDGGPFTIDEMAQYFGTEPLFRGAVLESYESGRWNHQPPDPGFLCDAERPRHSNTGTIRLQIALEPIGSSTLFTFGNFIAAEATDGRRGLQWNALSNDLQRGFGADVERQFHYSVLTNSAPPESWRGTLWRWQEEFRKKNYWETVRQQFPRYLQFLLKVPAELRPPLQEILAGIVPENTPPPAAAQAIENWFQNSGQFGYTLRLAVIDPGTDPILDFLNNRRTGHCEYFAASMVMLLRTCGIPARMISGFKGGVLDPASGAFTVQQLHAHAWVEAFIDGAWQTFDPTPALRNETVQNLELSPAIWRRLQSVFERAWTRGARLSRDEQDELIYQPLREAGTAVFTSTRDLLQGKREAVERMVTFLKSPREWWSWTGFALGLMVLALAAAAFRALQPALALLRRLAQALRLGRRSIFARSRRVPFFDRFSAILRRQGLVQRPAQTAQEFVEASLLTLQPKLLAHGLQTWPEELVRKFYLVRFGEAELPASELAELDRRLGELEACLKNGTAKSS